MLAPTMTAWPAASSMTMWCSRAGDRLLAAPEVGELRDEVAHRAAGDEQPGLLAEELGGAFLEGDDGRVVAEDVVADLGLGHGVAHGVGGPRDRVAAQVDGSFRHRSREYRRERRTRPVASAIVRPRRNWTRGVAAQHASLSRWRSPVRIRSGPPSTAFSYAPSARPDGAFLCPAVGPLDAPSRAADGPASVTIRRVKRLPLLVVLGLIAWPSPCR